MSHTLLRVFCDASKLWAVEVKNTDKMIFIPAGTPRRPLGRIR
jgi:hypothetical protein